MSEGKNGAEWNDWAMKGTALAFALSAKKDKISEVLNKLYDEETGKLKFMDWPRRIRSFGRMLKAYFSGEYKNISPFLFVNTAVGVGKLINSMKKNYGRKLLNLEVLEDVAIVIFILDTFGEEIRKFEMWEVEEHVKHIRPA